MAPGGRGGRSLAVIALVIVASIELVGGRGRSDHALKAVPAASVGAVDPRTYRITSIASVPGEPDRLAAGTTRLWTTTGESLVAVDSRRAKIDQIVQPGVDPSDVAVGYGSVWVLGSGGIVTQVDPIFGSVTRRIPIHPRGADTGFDSALGSRPRSQPGKARSGSPTCVAASSGSIRQAAGRRRSRSGGESTGSRWARVPSGR